MTRSALQNAASIAALFLTTEAVIVDKPDEWPDIAREIGSFGSALCLNHV